MPNGYGIVAGAILRQGPDGAVPRCAQDLFAILR